ncbi:MAG: hypothetical protein N3A63_05015 [Bacteroidetes bacterium]|nr:hypothetical protein [Bacteroidota bacterium]
MPLFLNNVTHTAYILINITTMQCLALLKQWFSLLSGYKIKVIGNLYGEC